MPPPKLTGYAPILNILHPIEVNLRPALGNELDLTRLYSLDGGLSERLHLDEPLLRKTRLDDLVAAVAMADLIVVILNVVEIALGLKISDESLAAFKTIHAAILRACKLVHVAIVGHDVDLCKAMALADEEVVGVMSGGYLYDARTELLLYIIVGENGNLAASERKDHILADNRGETLVLRIDRNSRIAGEGFGTRRGNADVILVELALRAKRATRHGIAHIPEMAVIRLVLNLVVRKSRSATRAPVDDVVALVDETLVVELRKDLGDGLGAALVQRDALALPVRGVAEHTLLMDNRAAILLLPLPNALYKRFAPEILAAFTLLAERLLHHILRSDAGVVRAWKPERILALHTAPPDKNILNRLVERVAHVKNTRYVWRWDNHTVRLALAGFLVKKSAVFPKGIPLGLCGLGVVMLIHHSFINFLFDRILYQKIIHEGDSADVFRQNAPYQRAYTLA